MWDYLNARGLKHNPIYDKGYRRVGCIGCPLASDQVRELEDWPKYKELYIKAFDRMMDARRASGKDDVTGKDGNHIWRTGEDVYRWWTNDTSAKGQTTIFDFMEE